MARIGATDAHEQSMEFRGSVRHRDKLVARTLALIMLASFVSFLAASIAMALGWGADIHIVPKVLTFVMTPLFLFVLLTRTVVRTAVTSEQVAVDWGLTKLRIPLGALSKVTTVTPEQARSQGGYELYCPGSFTEAVWLEWLESTRPRRALVGASDPRALARAIEEARAGRVRVDAPATAAAGANSDAETEAEMASEAEARAQTAKRG